MKLKETIVIALAGLVFMLITGIAKADDKSLNISEVPNKISNFVSGEISKTKEYQKKVWSEANNKWPWNVLFKGKNDTQN